MPPTTSSRSPGSRSTGSIAKLERRTGSILTVSLICTPAQRVCRLVPHLILIDGRSYTSTTKLRGHAGMTSRLSLPSVRTITLWLTIREGRFVGRTAHYSPIGEKRT